MTDQPASAVVTRQVVRIPVRQILVNERDRLRPVDMDWVLTLTESIKIVGLMTPIEVRRLDDGQYLLVSGAHRLGAVMGLGWETIDAEVRDLEDLAARMRELHENLYRHELSPWDKAVFLAEAKRIHLLLYPETRQGGAVSQVSENKKNDTMSFSRATALAAGYSRRTIERSISIYADIAPAVREQLRGSPIARDQAELLRLAKRPHSEQVRIVELLRTEGGPKRVQEAADIVAGKRKTTPTPGDRWFQQALVHWGRGGTRDRRNFLQTLYERGDLDGFLADLRKREETPT